MAMRRGKNATVALSYLEDGKFHCKNIALRRRKMPP
jgi:hypothetical protein